MAKRKPGVSIKNRPTMNTKWLNNAIKSIGSATAASFKDIAPNIYEASETIATVGTNAVKSIRTSKGSINRLNSTLSGNKYVKLAKDSFNQINEDLKSGNFYNPDRSGVGGEEDEWDSMMNDFSDLFNDSDSEPSMTFNYINEDSGTSDSMLMLSDAVSKGAEAQVKATKASVDAMISLSSTMMMQNQEAMDDIRNHLTNINSTLSGILEYHEQNTTNFYESAIAAFERFGQSFENKEKQKEDPRYQKDDKFTNLFNSKGALDLNAYKKFVKDNVKKTVEGSPAGMLLPFLQDDQMLEMIIADPVGGLTKGVIGGMIPKVIQGTLEEVDKTFSTFLPNMLSKLGKEANNPDATKFMQMIGKIFGINPKNLNKLDINDRFNGEAAIFDDVTRNSIVEVIPKYLRDSTQYLKEIAGAVTKKDPNKLLDNSEVFDLNTSSYKKVGDLKEEIAKGIQESIVEAFASSDFGRIINSTGSNLAGKQGKAFEKVKNELFTQLARVDGGLDVSDFNFKNKDSAINAVMKNVSRGTKDEKQAYNLLKNAINYMYKTNYGIDSANKAYIMANSAKEEKFNNFAMSPEFSNIIAAGITSDTDMDEFVDRYTGNKQALAQLEKARKEARKKEARDEREAIHDGRRNRKNGAKKEAIAQINAFKETEKTLRENDNENRGKISSALFGEDFGMSFATAGEHAKNSMWAVMKGDTATAGKEFAAIFGDVIKQTWDSTKKNFFEPLKKTFFGEKDNTGYVRGGLFEVTQNKAKDTFKEFMQKINGKDYVDSQGRTHSLSEDDTSFVGEASKVLKSIKDSIKYKIFGDEEKDEKGLLGKAKDAFSEGLNGWKEALFGGDEDGKFGEEDKKKLKDAIIKNTPRAALGATMGMLTGIAAGGATGSMLGMMVGGPIGGAVLGMAGGILSNSEKFKNYLFGPEIEDENGKRRIGGLISEKTQNFLKDKKKTIIGGAALGAMKGMFFPGAGLLTTVLGGPIAGAATGIATGLLFKSETFQKFLWGDEKSGKEGVLQALKGMFKKKNKDENDKDGSILKSLGMAGIGTAGAGISAALLGKIGVMGALAGPLGPIGAAVTGAAIGIASQGKKFKDWMFGEKDEETGKRKGGMINKFQNWMHVEVVAPIKAKAETLIDDFKTTIKYDVLENIRLPFLALRDGIKDAISPAVDKAKDFFGDTIKKVTEPLANAANMLVFKPMRKVLSVATDAAYMASKMIVTAPLKIVGGIARYTKSKINKFFSTITGFAKSTFLTIGKGFFNLGKGLLGFGAKKLGNGINRVRNLAGGIGELIPDSVKDKATTIGGKFNRFLGNMTTDGWLQDYYGTKADRLDEIKRNKNAAKDRANLVKNRRQMAALLGYDVKYFTEENMARAEEAAKAQGKKIHWNKRFGNMEFDTDPEEAKKAMLEKDSATIAENSEQSNDPDIRAIGQRERMINTLQETNELIREFMDAGLDEEEARKEAEKLREELAEERYRNGINEDGTVDFDRLFRTERGGRRSILDRLRNPRMNDSEYDQLDAMIREREREIFTDNGRARAEGGPVKKGEAYLVGDGGNDSSAEEIFIPNSSGKILSQGKDGLKVQIQGFAKGAMTSIKDFIFGKQRSKKEEATEDVVVETEDGISIQSMTKKQAAMYKNALDEKKDREAAALDSAQDAENKANASNAGSYETRKKAEEEEKEKSQRLTFMNKVMGSLSSIGNKNEEHQSLWSKIFGGKGLVSNLLTTALPWVITNLPSIAVAVGTISAITGGFKPVMDTISGFIETAKERLGWTNEHDARTNGETAGERIGDNVEDAGEVVKDLAHGNLVGAAANFVLDEDRYDAGSGARVSYLTNKGIEFAHTKWGKAAGTAAKKGYQGVKTAGKTAVEVIRNRMGKDIVAETGAKTVARESIEDVAETGAKKSSSKVINLVKTFFLKIAEKLTKKFPRASAAIGKAVKPLITKVTEFIGKHAPTLMARITGETAGRTAADAATLGLDRIVLLGAGALNGATGAKRLFYVDKVDFKMIAISTIIGSLAVGTTMGSIIDIISSLMADILGIDLLNCLGVSLYKAISNAEDGAKLDQATEEFRARFDAYRIEQIDEQYETQMKAGLIDPSVTIDEFRAGVEDGTYKASYDSFTDYNAEQHKTLGYRVGQVVTKGFQGIKGFMAGKTTFTDPNTGNYYSEIPGDKYQVFDMNGNPLGEISRDAVDVSNFEATTKGGVKNALNTAKEGLTKAGSVIADGLKNAAKAFNPVERAKAIAKFGSWLVSKETKKAYRSSLDGSFYDAAGKHYNADGEEIGGDIDVKTLSTWIASGALSPDEMVTKKSGLEQIRDKTKETFNSAKEKASTALKNFADGFHNKMVDVGKSYMNLSSKFFENFVGGTQEAWYLADGSGYYRFNGAKYIKCTMNGDETGEELQIPEFKTLLDSGVLTKGENVKVKSKASRWISETADKAIEEIKDIPNKAAKMLKDFSTATKEKMDQAAKGFTNFVSGSSEFFVSGTQDAWYLADGSGYYRFNGSKFIKCNMNGDETGEELFFEDFKKLQDSGILTKGDPVKVDSKIKQGFMNLGKNIADTFNRAVDKANATIAAVRDFKDDFDERVKKDGISGAISSYFKKTKEIAWYRGDGRGYYVMDDNGTYSYYNMNGDLISSGIKAESIQRLIENSLVTQGEIVKDSEASKAVKSIRDAVSNTWKQAKSTVTSKWDSFKNWILGGSGDGASETTSSATRMPGFGGRGNESNIIGEKTVSNGEDVNGFTYYSQNDSKWKSKEYVSNEANDGATMGDSGCGPTAMAMVAQNLNSRKKIDPTDMANMASAGGFRDSTGTNSEFIDYASNKLGLQHDSVVSPSAEYIKMNAANGNPTILNGISTSSGPFTNSGHYIVAVGTDKNGNILVNDPRGPQFSKAYKPEELAKYSNAAWGYESSAADSFTVINGGNGNRGFRRALKNKFKVVGGKGGSNFIAEDVIKIALGEVGYSEKASNSDLDNPKGNPGSANYTKYARDIGHSNGLAWCATFVVWCFTQAANGDKAHAKDVLCNANTAACASNQSAFKSAGQFTTTPQPGDVVFFMNGSSHTGIVVAVNGSKITTVEGNTSPGKFNRDGGCVAQKEYDINYPKISGFGRPRYDQSSDFSGLISNYSSDVGAATVDGTATATTAQDPLSALMSGFSGTIQQYASAAVSGNYNADITWGANNTTGTTGMTSTGQPEIPGAVAASGASSPRKGDVITLPNNMGTKNSFMGWQTITSKTSNQYKLRESSGEHYDTNGYGKIDGRYTVATTDTFGTVGDFIDIKRADGSVTQAVIADIKRQTDPGANKWGHQGGDCVVEFVVDKSRWYKSTNGSMDGAKIMHATNPGNQNSPVVSITNQGKYGGFGNRKSKPMSGRNYGGRGTTNVSVESAPTIHETDRVTMNRSTTMTSAISLDTVENLLTKVVSVLTSIDANTKVTETSNNSKNVTKNSNIILNNTTNQTTEKISTIANNKVSKNATLASQIAKGSVAS